MVVGYIRIDGIRAKATSEGSARAPDFQRFFNEVKPFFDAIDEMPHYEPAAVAGGKR